MNSIFFINLLDHEVNFRQIPLGVLSLATILNKSSDYDTKIIDFGYECKKGNVEYSNNLNNDINKMCTFILSKSPDVVIFYTMCSIYHIAVLLSKKIKELCPSIKIIFGGPQATLTADATLKAFPWIDLIGMGEGEKTIKTILNNMLNDKDLDSTSGIAYRREEQVVNNGLPDLVKDLDHLPEINYSLIDMSDVKEISLDTGRGCPYMCTFCSTKNFWRRNYRAKSTSRLIKEIECLKLKYNINNFNFIHDLFTAKQEYVFDICDMIINKGLHIKWTCSARVDTLNKEMIKKMTEAGCRSIFLGIETGSPRMQKLINKNLRIEKVYEVVDLLFKYNIQPRLSFIYGFPQETEEDVIATLNMINKLVIRHSTLINRIKLYKLSFFAGTELTDLYYDQLQYSEYNNENTNFTNQLPRNALDIIKKNKEIFPHFYEYRSDLVGKLELIDKFISYIYLRTLQPFKFTYRLLMEYYDNNILQLFYCFKQVEEETLRISSYHDINKGANRLIKAFESFYNFVTKSSFGTREKLIKEIARFEYDTMNFLYNSSQAQKIVIYNYNVYDIKKENSVVRYDEVITVKFIREDKKVAILKVD